MPFVYNEFTQRDEPAKPPGPPEVEKEKKISIVNFDQ